jgi:glycopeptide antibiotics resistance protein
VNDSLKRYFPAIAWSALILYLSANPGIHLPQSWSDLLAWDKLGHFCFYAIQTIFFVLWWKQLKVRVFLIAVFISICFGWAMECMQYLFFPNRYFEVLDLLANISGSISGAIVFRYLIIKKRWAFWPFNLY